MSINFKQLYPPIIPLHNCSRIEQRELSIVLTNSIEAILSQDLCRLAFQIIRLCESWLRGI